MGRTTFTTITPLPSSLTRETVIEFLHDHLQMIDLNPLVIERHPISPPPHALPEEQQCVWYSLTDKISYLPGGIMTSQVSYTCAFHDIPQGLQTHCYAPMGLDIRDRWSVGGSMPGEPQEPVELGLNAPQNGLYLREDVELRCNFIMASFVKKTMKQSHGTLVDKLAEKANIAMFSKSTQDVASDAWTSEASTPSSAWMAPQGVPPARSDIAATPLPGPLLPVPKTKKSVPTPGPPSHQQHSEQTFGPYGYQTPPRAAGSQQDAKTQPQPQVPQPQSQPLSDGQSKHSRDELFHPEHASGASQQSFSLQPPSNPQAKLPPETLSHAEQVSKPPPTTTTTPIVQPLPNSQSNNTSREELFHPENTPGNRTSFSLSPPTDPKAQVVKDKVSEPQHSFIVEPPTEPQARSSRDELFHPENASRLQGTFILRPPSDPRITESPGGLSYSGTVYRGKSRPEHYTEFAGSNPYEA